MPFDQVPVRSPRRGRGITQLPESDSIGEAVYLAMRDAIVTGAMPAGSRLREQDLSQRFRVSRTPVREALKRLETEQLVSQEPGRGRVVSSHTVEEVIDTYIVDEVLEGLVASLASKRASETDLLRLEQLLHGVEEAIEARDFARVAELNAIFEATLLEICGNARLRRTIADLQTALSRLPPSKQLSAERLRNGLAEHRRIVDAIRARDAVAADRAARDHLARHRDDRIQAILLGASYPAADRLMR